MDGGDVTRSDNGVADADLWTADVETCDLDSAVDCSCASCTTVAIAGADLDGVSDGRNGPSLSCSSRSFSFSFSFSFSSTTTSDNDNANCDSTQSINQYGPLNLNSRYFFIVQ